MDQLTPCGCRRCYYPLCCCCRMEITRYVGFHAYFPKPSSAPAKCHAVYPLGYQNLKHPLVLVLQQYNCATSHIKDFACLGDNFCTFHPLPRYIHVPGLFGQPNIANINDFTRLYLYLPNPVLIRGINW